MICPHCGQDTNITMQLIEHRLLAWFFDNPDRNQIVGTATEIGEMLLPDLTFLKKMGVTVGVLLSKGRKTGKDWVPLEFTKGKKRFEMAEERTTAVRIYTIRRKAKD